MASLLQILSTCLGFNRNYNALSPFDEDQVKAGQVITALNSADKAGSDLTMELNSIVGAKKWTRRLARAILHHLEHALVKGHVRGHALQHAYNRAFEEAADFPHDHPVFCTLLALGILVILAPWVLEALGFAELGPVEGTFAAWWQSTYAGYVSRRSLFAFFQRLGMVWRRVGKA